MDLLFHIWILFFIGIWEKKERGRAIQRREGHRISQGKSLQVHAKGTVPVYTILWEISLSFLIKVLLGSGVHPAVLIVSGQGAGDQKVPLACPSEETGRCHQWGGSAKYSVGLSTLSWLYALV